MTPPSFKSIGTIALALSAGSLLNAETVTDPLGVVKITIAAAPSGGTKLTAISATLRNSIAYHGTATSVGSYNADAGSNPPNPDQPITQTGAGWTTNQWTTEPHLCYIENAAGAEEAYLIKSHTADTLTLATSFDFSTRYTSTPTFRIVKAHTFGSLFGTDSVPFHTAASSADADVIYAWDGADWSIFWHNGTNWKKSGLFGSANDVVIFPDEGLFVLRTQDSAVTLTLSGSVATKPQISTIPGGAFTFISSRYPVGTTVGSLGFENLPNWLSAASVSDADKFYVWDNGWAIYWHNGTNWKKTGLFGSADNEPIAADSAIFVERISTSSAANSANSHTLPYNP